MKLKFHPGARIELNQAVDYYDEQRRGLGQEFFDEVIVTIEKILDFPETWPVHSAATRSCLTQRFPYRLVYQFKGDEVRLIAVAHQSRKPGYWEHRLEKGEV